MTVPKETALSNDLKRQLYQTKKRKIKKKPCIIQAKADYTGLHK